ncbi:hypothetical protein V425_13160 [Lactococcus lactis RTB018]|nr:hypothetical protein V425_13160 [Lactococcus lactis RTB018]
MPTPLNFDIGLFVVLIISIPLNFFWIKNSKS